MTQTQTKKTRTRRKSNGAAPATSAPQPPASTSVTPAHDAITKLREALKGAIKERDREVDAVLSAMLCEEHVVLLGPPGTAKSMLTRLVCKAIDGATYFEWMMTRYTEPNELFGPTDLKRWTDTGEYTRIMDGKLPTADIAFVDEIYKANSAILNAMLPVINERVFHDGAAGAHHIPLRTMIGASNELPESGGELEALHDRFLVRLMVGYVNGEDSFMSVLFDSEPDISGATLTFDTLDTAIDEARQMALSPDVGGALFNLRAALAKEGIAVSDRRWRKLVGLLKAYAYLMGDACVDTIHFEVLTHGLWRDPREIAKVQSVINKVSSPALSDASDVFDALVEQINGLSDDDIQTAGPSVAAELKKGIAKLDAAIPTVSPAIGERIAKMRDALDEHRQKITERVMEKMGMTT